MEKWSELPLQERIKLTKQSILGELEQNEYIHPKGINIETKYLLEIIEAAEKYGRIRNKIIDQTVKNNHETLKKLADS